MDVVMWVKEWAGTMSTGLALALVLGGVELRSTVDSLVVREEVTRQLASTTDTREETLERSVAGVDAKLEALHDEVDGIKKSLDEATREAQQDRATILHELGQLQGRTDADRRPTKERE